MLDSTKRWYAVYTKSRNEKKVSEGLIERGVEHYLPLVKTLKQWSDRKKHVEEPLFKSYIFVKVNNEDYLEVLKTPGTVCFVTIAKEKIPIPDFQIEAVKTYLGEISVEKSLDYFELGNEIEVAYGPMKGLRGTLVSAKDHRKLIVRIDAINQNITLTLPANLIKKVNSPY